MMEDKYQVVQLIPFEMEDMFCVTECPFSKLRQNKPCVYSVVCRTECKWYRGVDDEYKHVLCAKEEQ